MSVDEFKVELIEVSKLPKLGRCIELYLEEPSSSMPIAVISIESFDRAWILHRTPEELRQKIRESVAILGHQRCLTHYSLGNGILVNLA